MADSNPEQGIFSQIAGDHRQRILIVDDAEENLLILENLLADMADIHTARDGAEALAVAEELLPDLVLLDVRMPTMDGHEVCKRLKASDRTRNISVVFVTGLSDEEDEELGLELGAVDYVTKPFSPAIIMARVRNHLELQKAHRNLRLANEELTRLATTDFLTGVWNRRRFLELGQNEVSRLRRNGRGFGTVMMDVDHFKSVNDTYGHDAGDTVLRALADACVHSLRNVDIIGRLGGEEFAMILPETDPAGVRLTAERLRQDIGQMAVPIGGKNLSFTISAGYTCVTDPNDSIENALSRADEALYQAKGAGRNRTIGYEELKRGMPGG